VRALFVAVGLTGGVAAAAPAARVHAEALAGGYAYTVAVSLADEVGSRVCGSAGADRAVKWATAQLKAAGLENVHTEAVEVPRWVRGEESAEVLTPAVHRLHVGALGGSVATPAGGLTAEVLEVGSLAELKALPENGAAGKIVYLHVVMKRSAGFEGYGEAVPARSQGAVAAANKGAVAVLVRSIGTGGGQLVHTGAMRYDDSVAKIPTGALSAEDGDLLHRLRARGPVKVRLDLSTKHEGMVKSANVVGDWKGKDRAEEIVLVGAHLDSWDLGLGALDDAAGVGMALDTVRTLSKLGLRPRRTVRVVLFMNEEFGLSGAFAYAASHAAELGKHVAAFEADAGAGKPTGIGVVGNAAAVKWLGGLTAPIAALPAVRSVEEAGADLIPMRPAGVPGLAVLQDVSHYFDWHHTTADTVDKIDPAELAAASAALATTVFVVADAPDTLPRVPTPLKPR